MRVVTKGEQENETCWSGSSTYGVFAIFVQQACAAVGLGVESAIRKW